MKIFFWLLATVLLTTVRAAEAQQTTKIPRIGRLGAGFPVTALETAFREGLREFGYVDGHNIAVEDRHADAKTHRLSELAADLVRMKVAVIVAGSDDTIHAAQQEHATIQRGRA